MTVRRKFLDIKQDKKSVEEFAELVQEMVTEGYPDAPESVIDTIATDTFLTLESAQLLTKDLSSGH